MSLLNQIFDAGIVGCGGAGFPTHIKLKASVGTLIMNAAECEPLLRTDRYIMRNFPMQLVSAFRAVSNLVSAKACVIALKGAYRDEINALEQAISDTGAPIKLHKMDSFYPAGDEHVIVYEVTGKTVPAAGIPLDVDTVVMNVGTTLCVYDAMLGKPFTYKYLTVTGEVNKPVIIKAPIGTSVKECIMLAGGAKSRRYFVKNGGPMMGRAIAYDHIDAEVVTKTTSGLLILPEEGYLSNSSKIPWANVKQRAASVCIQCSYCTQLCPRYLMGHPLEPHKIMRALAMGDDVETLLKHPAVQNAALCSECGICSIYSCPMGLQPSSVNKVLKDGLARTGIRFQKGISTPARDMREYRNVPTRRIASRAGVLPYYDYQIEEMVTADPDIVSIPLKQHIGAPSIPVVKEGDIVTAEQLIAKCPEGKPGANIHASISGIVRECKDSVIIQKG